MTLIEDYLFDIYHSKSKMYKKIYYQKNKQKIINYNLKRYSDRLLKGEFKLIRGHFTIILKWIYEKII